MKTNSLGISIFVLGLAAVCWVGLGYLGSNLPALLVTLLIAALYLVGALELHRYRRATGTLDHALSALDGDAPAALDQWLQGLHPSLRGPVQLRIETGRAGLPTPTLAPYLVGMLVLLGMLGTLLGMVLTLRGTGMALQTATDLQAVRDSLAAPVSGLGVAFGASIAGVASSAALGLLSALVRRERIDAVQRLDTHVATTLRGHSQARQREQALALLQQQAGAMPALVERLESMMAAMERQSQDAHAQQARQQETFHATTHAAYGELAQSVGQSLQASAAEGARLAGQALVPVMESTLADISQQAAAMHASVARASEQQLQALDASFSQRTQELLERIGERMQSIADGTAAGWERALAGQQAGHEALVARQQQALDSVGEGFASQSTALLRTLSDGMQRNAAMLEGQTRMLQTLDTLLAAVNRASGEQRAAIDALVTTSSELLERVGARFGEQVEAGGARLEQASGRLDAGMQDVASLGQSLAGAVQAFSDSSTGLVERLQAIEGALDRSLQRSDEQLAYYVAQAREVVDLSVLTQRQIIGNLQQLSDQAEPAGADAA